MLTDIAIPMINLEMLLQHIVHRENILNLEVVVNVVQKIAHHTQETQEIVLV